VSAYLESFVPPHRMRSIPLEYVDLDGLGEVPTRRSSRRVRQDRIHSLKRRVHGLSDSVSADPISDLGDLSCPCGNGLSPSLGDMEMGLGAANPPTPGLLDTLASAVAGVVGGKGSVKSRVASAVVQGARFRSQFSGPIDISSDQIFGGDETAQPSQSTFSLMGIVKPGVELQTVGGVFKIFPWGEPADGEYELYLIGGLVAAVAVGALGCKLLGKVI